jgi:hypothetical protein
VDDRIADVLVLAPQATPTAESAPLAARRVGGRRALAALSGGATACALRDGEAVEGWRV